MVLFYWPVIDYYTACTETCTLLDLYHLLSGQVARGNWDPSHHLFIGEAKWHGVMYCTIGTRLLKVGPHFRLHGTYTGSSFVSKYSSTIEIDRQSMILALLHSFSDPYELSRPVPAVTSLESYSFNLSPISAMITLAFDRISSQSRYASSKYR